MTKVKELSNKLATQLAKHRNVAAMAAAGAACTPMTAFAAPDTTSATNMVYEIASVVVNIFPLVGIFFVLSGVFKLVMAYRQDNPEGQSAAAKDIVIGVVFIAFRVFIWTAVKDALVSNA